MAERRDDDDNLEVGDLRSLFSSMREADEEPPSGGMASLMAAARTKADEMRPTPSLFERFAAAFRRPAVLAFASVAILATGAVVVTRHQDEAPHVTASSPQEELREKSADSAPAPAASPTPQAGEAKMDEAPGQGRPVETAVPKGEAAIVSKTASTGAAPVTPKTPKTPPRMKQQQEIENDSVVAGAPSPVVSAPAAEPPPREATRGAPRPQIATDPADAGEGSSPDKNQNKIAVSTAQLVKKCELAAANNDCATVRIVAKEIAAHDPAAYKTKLRTNPAIARCLEVGVDAAAAPVE